MAIRLDRRASAREQGVSFPQQFETGEGQGILSWITYQPFGFLLAPKGARVQIGREVLQGHLAAGLKACAQFSAQTRIHVPEAIERLRSLGYLDGSKGAGGDPGAVQGPR